MLIYCWKVNLYQKYAKNGTEKVNLYQYAKKWYCKGWNLSMYQSGIAVIEYTLSNQDGIEMLKICNKEWGVLERLKYRGTY